MVSSPEALQIRRKPLSFFGQALRPRSDKLQRRGTEEGTWVGLENFVDELETHSLPKVGNGGPQLRVVRHLNSYPAIRRTRPRFDLRRQIVEN